MPEAYDVWLVTGLAIATLFGLLIGMCWGYLKGGGHLAPRPHKSQWVHVYSNRSHEGGVATVTRLFACARADCGKTLEIVSRGDRQ